MLLEHVERVTFRAEMPKERKTCAGMCTGTCRVDNNIR